MQSEEELILHLAILSGKVNVNELAVSLISVKTMQT